MMALEGRGPGALSTIGRRFDSANFDCETNHDFFDFRDSIDEA